jgi:hypothetical protein
MMLLSGDTNTTSLIVGACLAVGGAAAIASLARIASNEARCRSDFDLMRQFLLAPSNDGSSSRRHKPPLWIHLPYESNSRVWDAFAERRSNNLNQPYVQQCIEMAIAHCGDDMNVCIIDDSSFARLLPGLWSRVADATGHTDIVREDGDLSTLPDPQRSHLRAVAQLELVHRYGGIVMPYTFLCFRNLCVLLDRCRARGDSLFVVENANRGGAAKILATTTTTTTTGQPNALARTGLHFAPDARFFGSCEKANPLMAKWTAAAYAQLRRYGVSSQELDFSQFLSHWCLDAVAAQSLVLVSAPEVCVAYVDAPTRRTLPMTVDDLFESSDHARLSQSALGVWIPGEQIICRKKFAWFANISLDSILRGDYLLAAMFRHSQSTHIHD